MVISRRVGFMQGLRYHGGLSMATWMLHRISGVGILALAGLHVLFTFIKMQTGGGAAIALNAIYKSWPLQMVIIFFVFFHALNGFRIILLDVWPQLGEHQRASLWLQWLVLIPLYGLTVLFLLQKSLGG
jgi:succinate dehydrogenase / fumarate reductase, cytochrome b subunit